MDSMNSFADLQALQQPSLGQALTMQPQQQQPQQPQQPAQGPPATPEEYGQRVQGWTDTLSEMLANPMVSVALLQMGAALSAGRSAPEAMADTAGAVGRAGTLTDQYRRRQEGDEMLRRKAGLEEKRFGLEERELGAREKLWNAQTQNYERMARGGGGGGGGAGAGDATAKALERWNQLYKWRLSQNGGNDADAKEFADSATFGNSKLPKPDAGMTPSLWLQEARGYDALALDAETVGNTKAAEGYKKLAADARAAATGRAAASAGPSVEDRILAGLEKGGAFGAPAARRELPATIQKNMPAAPAAARPSAANAQRALGIMTGGLPPEIADKVRSGIPLTAQEQALLNSAQANRRAQEMSH